MKSLASGGIQDFKSYSAWYEQRVKTHHALTGEYASLPLVLSPASSKRLNADVFNKASNNGLGVKVTFPPGEDVSSLNPQQYKGLLNTCAYLFTNTMGLTDGVKEVRVTRGEDPCIEMDGMGTLWHTLPRKKSLFSFWKEPKSSYWESATMHEREFLGSGRQSSVFLQHEALHDRLMNVTRDVLGFNPATMTITQNDTVVKITDELLQSHLALLQEKISPEEWANLVQLLTPYFTEGNPQELYTTALEALYTLILAKIPITKAMAQAVGSTVEALEAKKAQLSSSISGKEEETLNLFRQVLLETPLDLRAVWHEQKTLRNYLLSQEPRLLDVETTAPSVVLPVSAKEEAFIKQHAETLNIPWRFMWFINSFWRNPAMEEKMITEMFHALV